MRRAVSLLLAAGLAACRPAESAPDGYRRVSPQDIRIGGAPSVSIRAGEAVPPGLYGAGEVVLPDGRKVKVETARSPLARERGLMYRTEFPPDAGMLFYFARTQNLNFWMKNTFIDLDMIFLDADKAITVVHAGVPRSRRDTPDHLLATRSGTGRYVLELPAGAAKRYGLKTGQRLGFDD